MFTCTHTHTQKGKKTSFFFSFFSKERKTKRDINFRNSAFCLLDKFYGNKSQTRKSLKRKKKKKERSIGNIFTTESNTSIISDIALFFFTLS